MKLHKNGLLCLLLCLGLLMGSVPAFAAGQPEIDAAAADVAAFLVEMVPQPQVSATGGEWAVLGLARSGAAVPEGYFDGYYRTLEETLRACDGVLHDKKYTEYSRVVLALTAIGKDPTDVAGYNLLLPLGDYEKTIWQGMNGPIWALLALDSAGYEIPQNAQAQTQATRELYVSRILDCQLADGGWSLLGGTESASEQDAVADPDVTGMALQALAKYQQQPEVAEAIARGLDCMSQMQQADGGFTSWGTRNLESCVQMIVALCELGIPYDDARFVKDGVGLLDFLLAHYTPGAGFSGVAADESNQMATEQGFYALVAIQRQLAGQSGLYCMTDDRPDTAETPQQPDAGLPGKHADVQVPAITQPARTFADIAGHVAQQAVEGLAAREIINGMDETHFAPDNTMTRAEFSAIVVRALGLPQTAGVPFADVPDDAWFADAVGTAQAYGIVTGVSDTAFDPYGTITREQAAVMVTRAAELCGLQTQMDAVAARNVLAGFSDYMTVSDWAFVPMAACYDWDILPDEALEILPKQAITRAEIAQMVYALLNEANLL